MSVLQDRVDELERKPHSKRKGCFGFARELIFWAVLLDFIGGACYMAGSIWLSWNYVDLVGQMPFTGLKTGSPSPAGDAATVFSSNTTFTNCTFDQLTPTALDESAEAIDDLFTFGDGVSCRFFMFGDLSYTFDAVLYIILWYREHRRMAAQRQFDPYASMKETPDLAFPGFDPMFNDRIGISS